MSAPLAGGGAATVPAGPPPGAAQLAPAPLAPAAQLLVAPRNALVARGEALLAAPGTYETAMHGSTTPQAATVRGS